MNIIDVEIKFLKRKDNDGDIIYYNTEKIGVQTAVISFIENPYKNKICYYVAFTIANKKRDINGWLNGEANNINLKETGRNGLTPLLWAKKQIVDFEKWIVKGTYDNKDIYICIVWDDNRRRNAYQYGLRKNGYIFGNIDGYKCLYKQII